MQEVYDWAGSYEDLPLYFTISRRMEVIKHDHTISVDETVNLVARVSH